MARTVTALRRSIALPRGWVVLGLALACWALVIGVAQMASTLFGLIAASL